ncbi:MAG: winged helix-turn-helix transcriptional regulator [Candidatus Thorarchaeota archaeon]
MARTPSEAYNHIDRLFQTISQWIGLQRTAGSILAALYADECEGKSRLSVSELSERTGLSLSTVSSICSQLETLGITMKQSDDSQNGRGRRKSVVSLRFGIDGLLRLGMTRHIDEVSRNLRDIELVLDRLGIEPSNSIQRALSELSLFLAEPYSIT